MKKSGSCGILALIARLAAAGVLLWKGVPKLWAGAEKIEFIGSAGPAMLETIGLNVELFSTPTRFWLAVIGELLAALLLLLGYKARWGALLALIVMLFVLNIEGTTFFSNWPAMIIAIGSLIVLFKGAGKWSVDCKNKCSGDCDKHTEGEDTSNEKAAKPSPKKDTKENKGDDNDKELFHAEDSGEKGPINEQDNNESNNSNESNEDGKK